MSIKSIAVVQSKFPCTAQECLEVYRRLGAQAPLERYSGSSSPDRGAIYLDCRNSVPNDF